MADTLGEQHTIDITSYRKQLEDELYSAATNGNWEKAKKMFEQHLDDIKPSTRIGPLQETALSAAIRKGKTNFVEKLIKMMRQDDELDIKDEQGNTPFYYAVAYGQIRGVTILLQKKPDLDTTTLINRHGRECLPIEIAAANGQDDIVRLLYERTKLGFGNGDQYHIDAFSTFIDNGFFDIASIMLSANPRLATQVNSERESALYVIAGDHGRQRIDLTEQLLKQANGRADLIKGALFRAAREGNSAFIERGLRLYPQLAKERDNGCTLFHVAVQHRRLDAFNVLMKAIDYDTSVVKLMSDKERNKILDLAAKLPKGGPKVVPGGAALQLQFELLWFKEVMQLFNKKGHDVKHKNKSYTRLFDKMHEQLRREGQRWLTSTSTSCMLVAGLLIAVLVAGLFNVPGGSKQDTGVPIHLWWLKTFIISYGATSIFSASSILFFLSILTSNFQVKEFLKSLPSKLFFGLISLFLSIIAMVVTFVAAFFIHYEQFAYPVAALALVLIVSASYLQLPLLVQLFVSTFAPLHFRGKRISVSELEKKYR